jgi:hypothetical protein
VSGPIPQQADREYLQLCLSDDLARLAKRIPFVRFEQRVRVRAVRIVAVQAGHLDRVAAACCDGQAAAHQDLVVQPLVARLPVPPVDRPVLAQLAIAAVQRDRLRHEELPGGKLRFAEFRFCRPLGAVGKAEFQCLSDHSGSVGLGCS